MASTSSSRTSRGTTGSAATSRTAGASRTGAATFTAEDAEGADVTAKGAGTASAAGAGTSRGGRAPRRIRLTLARLDPFSVMKLSFLMAIGIGIATVIAVALLWGVVDGIGLWDSLNDLGKDLNGGKPLAFLEYFAFSKMVSYSVVVAFVNLVIITALGTLFAFLYNIVASLLGGLKMTFTDE